MAKIVSYGVSEPHVYFDCNADHALQLFLPTQPAGSKNALAWKLLRVLALALLLCATGRAHAQTTSPPAPNATPDASQGQQPTSMHGQQDQDPMAHGMETHMAERRNSERQKTLVADTDKLLALAQQLKADVDKSNKDTLSIDVVKRAEQIEKLARSVKEKMRGN
jgi:hypothetical protein